MYCVISGSRLSFCVVHMCKIAFQRAMDRANSFGAKCPSEEVGQSAPQRKESGRLSAVDQSAFKSLLDNLNALRLNKQLCDVEIECQGSTLLAHKVVLAASIDYFRGLYNLGMADAHQGKISIREPLTFAGLSQIVNFAYTYEVNITAESVRELLEAANYLGVAFVKDGCERFLMKLMTNENVLELRHLADQQSCQQLLDEIDKFLLEHFAEVCYTAEFLALNSVATLERLAQSDDLSIGEEQCLFEFIVKWIETDTDTRLPHLARLLRHVRFFQLPLAYFLGTVRKHPLVLADADALSLVRSQTDAFLGAVSATVAFSATQQMTQQLLPGRGTGARRKMAPRAIVEGSASPIGRNISLFSTPPETATTAAACLDQTQLNALLQHNEGLAALTRPRKAGAGVIFCVGGRGPKLDPFRSVEVYEWPHNRWCQIGELRIGRRHVGVVCVSSRIFAIGGHDGTEHLSSVECLDVREQSWCEVAPLNVRRRGMAVGTLGGAIYAIGGLDDQNCYKTVERYDIALDEWSHVADMHTPRGGVAVAAYENGLYAIGGNSGTSSLDSCERYDPILDKWTPIAPMRNRRAGGGVAVIGPYLYVIGGFDDDSPLSTCERYSFSEDAWTEIPSLSCARGGVGVAAMGGRIFAIGGHDSKNYLNTVEAFDPLSQNWTEVASINQRRAGAGVAWSNCSVKEIAFPIRELR